MVLFALVGFIVSTFELDHEEFKHNYKKEDHSNIFFEKSGTLHDFHVDHPVALLVCLISLSVKERFVQQFRPYTFFTDPDPPDKIYLLNSAFRI